MNALRNLLSCRTLNYLRLNGQNALINITQPVDSATNATGTKPGNDAETTAADRVPKPLLIPKSILDATTFNGKKFGPAGAAPGSISPTTLKRYRCIERKVELVYRCTLCSTRNSKMVSEAAYKRGVVILQCDGCSVNHLIIDNLGWFAKTNGKSFDQVLAEKGNQVKVIKVNEHGDLI